MEFSNAFWRVTKSFVIKYLFYLRGDEVYLLTKEQYANILRDLEKLIALENSGVEKWDKYESANNIFVECCGMSDDEVIEKFGN